MISITLLQGRALGVDGDAVKAPLHSPFVRLESAVSSMRNSMSRTECRQSAAVFESPAVALMQPLSWM